MLWVHDARLGLSLYIYLKVILSYLISPSLCERVCGIAHGNGCSSSVHNEYMQISV